MTVYMMSLMCLSTGVCFYVLSMFGCVFFFTMDLRGLIQIKNE